jgi:thymidine phosphorylase
LVEGFVDGRVDECQMAAWAMAVYWRGMTVDETVALTAAMLESGQTLAAADTSRRSWPAAGCRCPCSPAAA